MVDNGLQPSPSMDRGIMYATRVSQFRPVEKSDEQTSPRALAE